MSDLTFRPGSRSLSPAGTSGRPPRPALRPAGTDSQAFRPDPRLLLVLAVLYSLVLWKVAPPGLAACAGLFGLFRLRAGRPVLPVGGPGRALRFALFWIAIKIALDAVVLSPDGLSLVPAGALPGIALAAGILGLRLFLLLLLGLGLASLLSAPALGAALLHLTPPPLRRWCLQPAMALAFMARCLPEIFAAVGDARLAARARGLPDRGPAWWKIALPQIFRLPALRLDALATAAAVRDLDEPEAWPALSTGRGNAAAAFFLAAGSVMLPFC